MLVPNILSVKIYLIIVIVFLVFSGINFVFAQKTGSVALVFLSPDKEIYFPGDSVFIYGQDNMNVTSITIGLEKDHKVMVSSEDSQVLKNGTFYANFTLPRDSDAKYWSLVSGPLHQDLYFKPVYLSPLEQFREGIEPSKTRCEGRLDLVISHDNLPACVKPDTAQKLVERGWTKLRFETSIAINSDTPISNDTTYLSQTVDEWKSKTPEQLNVYYKKYKDTFYDELGSFLIKDEMKKELERQNIQNMHDDFTVFPGITLDSLPPHISYDAVVNATDGNSYLLLGGVFENKIDSLKITKLVFDKDALHSLSTGMRLYVNPFANAHVDNSTFQEKLKIAGTYVGESDIPWSSAGTGSYGVIEIGLYTSVYHMIPDAQKYYTARAMQLIPFYIPVKILPPPFIEK
jgi:hypothetical protein